MSGAFDYAPILLYAYPATGSVGGVYMKKLPSDSLWATNA